MISSEARFLEAREERAAQRPCRRSKNKSDELNAFWQGVRQSLKEWQRRLDAIKRMPCRTATQRSQTEAMLDQLLEELQELRRQCLSEAENSVSNELPSADVRLLHQEFTNSATRLDEVRQELCPPSKFVFARYRAAMRERLRHDGESAGCVEVDSPQATGQPSKTHEDDKGSNVRVPAPAYSGNAIRQYMNATIVTELDGSTHISPKDGADGENVVPPNEESDSASLLLESLEKCSVILNGEYKAIHLQNLSDCNVNVSNAVEGAIHITACHNVFVHGTCHQLRLHDSTGLKFRVCVGSGPILEDCTDIVFYAAPENLLVREAKDFNWLRNGIPSPNFRIIEEAVTERSFVEGADAMLKEASVDSKTEEQGKQLESLETPHHVSAKEQSPGDDEESDDEL